MHRLLALCALATLSFGPASAAPLHASPGQRVSFTYSGPLPRLLSALGQAYGRNVVAGASLEQTNATITLHNVSFRQALETIERAYHLYRQDVNGITYMGAANASTQDVTVRFPLHYADASTVATNLSQALGSVGTVIPDTRTNALVYAGNPSGIALVQRLIATLDTNGGAGGMQTVTIPLNHTDAKTAAGELQLALGRTGSNATIVPDSDNNTLVVTGPGGAIAQAQAVIGKFDQPARQVDVRVTVYDVTPVNDESNVGLTFGGSPLTGGAPSSSAQMTPNIFNLRWPILTTAINTQLNALISQGHAKVLASPNTVVQNGQEGKILVGETYPLVFQNGGLVGGSTVTTVNAGVILDVTPIYIGAAGSVSLKLHAEYSQITGFVQSYPILGNRSVDTVLTAQSGQPIVFGGLTESTESTTIGKVPLLGDIPLFGRLFRNVQTTRLKEEIIFQITPTVVGMTS